MSAPAGLSLRRMPADLSAFIGRWLDLDQLANGTKNVETLEAIEKELFTIEAAIKAHPDRAAVAFIDLVIWARSDREARRIARDLADLWDWPLPAFLLELAERSASVIAA